MSEPRFTVDTHIFKELGELLVGRDSTALIELVKNAYDADATVVVVHGQDLKDSERGLIRLIDDGIGMGTDEFENGFLRIAARFKSLGDRRSKRFGRRYTGAKGIGRLAAHKLARNLEVVSIPAPDGTGPRRPAVHARINWDAVEQLQTLDMIERTDALIVSPQRVGRTSPSGTTVTLSAIRKSWSEAERSHFISEVRTYQPPEVLIKRLPKQVLTETLLFEEPYYRDVNSADPGFRIQLDGDFAQGEDYWQALADVTEWIIEIDASSKDQVRYGIAPSQTSAKKWPDARRQIITSTQLADDSGPFFQGRIFLRSGHTSRQAKNWLEYTSGIRVYMEGFRVLPYGEKGNDWLAINTDYLRRSRTLPFIEQDETAVKDEGLTMLANHQYFGGIFLTETGAPNLRMLVNREGFVPDEGFRKLSMVVRRGIDLAIRNRASLSIAEREQRRVERAKGTRNSTDIRPLPAKASRAVFERARERANSLVREARDLEKGGQIPAATEKYSKAVDAFEEVARTSELLITEEAMLRVLASVGMQMAAFIHEIRGIVALAQAADSSMQRLRESGDLPRNLKRPLAQLHASIDEILRSLERQASYLVEVLKPDARRRRQRLSFAERFDAARRLIEHAASVRSIEISNEIPVDLKSLPMFAAELATVFTNLLTNAVKAAGEGGRVRASGGRTTDGEVIISVENTGDPVLLDDSEKWFRPFESTTVDVDPVLGQGMGMGLPITRAALEEYGAEIRFMRPTDGFATALHIKFPVK